MRKCVIFAATLLLFVMVSCNQDYLNPIEEPTIWNVDTRADKNPLDEIDFSALDTAYFVSNKDIEAYIHFKQLLAEGQGKDFEVLEIVPMGLNDEATLAYLLNYNEGWEIIAADKRAPMVLASGEEGSFSEYDAQENVMAWIECLESDVLGLRVCKERPEWADEEAWENMLSSVDFWLAINADEEYIARALEGTRNPKPVTGYWELVGSYVINSVISSTPDRLISDTAYYKLFHQGSPYNQYCPAESAGSGNHAKAGCLAVAGGTMMCYLHDKLGVPVEGVEFARYFGTISNYQPYYAYVTDDYDVWNRLKTDDSDKTYAASLLTFIGDQVSMTYGMTGSGAYTSSLVNNVFNYFGISCSFGTFSSSTVNSNLQNELPAIVDAYGTRTPNGDGSYTYSNSHVFIIDGYRTTQYTYQNVYRWVYVVGGPYPIIDDRIEIVVGSPVASDYLMRWGWDDKNPDGSYYAINGDWNSKVNRNYIYERNMITGFAVAN